MKEKREKPQKYEDRNNTRYILNITIKEDGKNNDTNNNNISKNNIRVISR